MSSEVQTISVAVWDVILHSLLSNKTVVAPLSKFSPVRVTVVPPSTEPNLGLIEMSLGVESAEYKTSPRGVVDANSSVPMKTLGVQTV